MTGKPNFLFFITDQHRADWLGCTGHPLVKTPNIDAIAANGTRFDNFHVASPVCMPNRASLMTGRMPSLHGLRYNGCVLPQRANTFVDVLAAGGYQTAAIGKSHLQPFTGLSPKREKDISDRLITEAWKRDTSDYGHEEPDRYDQDGKYSITLPYYGFQHVDMVTGHGDRCGGHYGQWFRETVADWQDLCDPVNELPHNYTCPQAYRTPIPEEFYPTTWIGDRAIEYLTKKRSEPDPFFAFVSFPDPHHPFNPPGKYWDMYSPEEFDVPIPFAMHKNPTRPMQTLLERWKTGVGPDTPQSAFYANANDIQQAMALTAGMITMIDDQVGRVVEALKSTGQFDNTIIIFTSDHGDYLGDFNLMLKGALPFKSVTQVPMIWADPTESSQRGSTSMLASTIDLPSSILARAGLPAYFGIQGQSFLPGLTEDVMHRDEILIEYNDGGPRIGFEKAARVRSVVTQVWRFTHYAGEDWGELYNLKEDPNETHNLWDDPAFESVKSQLALKLVGHLSSQMDESPRAERLA
ncbi:MAG: sulfatase-like hydrolase/transferase [Pseudomonadota bacterium]